MLVRNFESNHIFSWLTMVIWSTNIDVIRDFAICPRTSLNLEETMDIKTIGVLGVGSMGKGIAQVAAQTGYNVIAERC